MVIRTVQWIKLISKIKVWSLLLIPFITMNQLTEAYAILTLLSYATSHRDSFSFLLFTIRKFIFWVVNGDGLMEGEALPAKNKLTFGVMAIEEYTFHPDYNHEYPPHQTYGKLKAFFNCQCNLLITFYWFHNNWLLDHSESELQTERQKWPLHCKTTRNTYLWHLAWQLDCSKSSEFLWF